MLRIGRREDVRRGLVIFDLAGTFETYEDSDLFQTKIKEEVERGCGNFLFNLNYLKLVNFIGLGEITSLPRTFKGINRFAIAGLEEVKVIFRDNLLDYLKEEDHAELLPIFETELEAIQSFPLKTSPT